MSTDDAEAERMAEIQALRRENRNLLETVERLQIDFEHYRQRVLHEQTALVTRANEGLVNQLAPVLDLLRLVLADIGPDTAERARKSVESLYADLMIVLEHPR